MATYENNDYTSKGVGTAGLTLGVIGTALAYMVVAMPALEVWFIKWIGVEFDGVAWEHDYCCAFVPST